ncbi:hypothetical protein Verru16b_00723 [Lacunisphaera limnophila]|uniref:Uncharacterized protein n=1 Tax=Lacunisphaera limnophila TaxID=1838286 RepID=A0A1D8AS00_9BACT|nr:hypothetical protein [Lacunisphaera limnophila]AOS43671.1 hypothetical protein Verru16b_00723 [Lacunisphaera limnophila]
MKYPVPLLAAVLLLNAGAQTAAPVPVPGAPSANRPRPATPAKATAAKAASGVKAVLPDPDLLDGSKYEPEKRPLYGMLSEIEMGEEEGGEQDRVSPNSGPAGQPPPPGQENKPGGAGPEQEKQGSAEKIEEGPAAKPEGAQAQKINAPEGAQQQAGGPQGSAREMQIGDATLQIQTEAKSPDVVGQEASKAQQYEKPTPAGQQSNTRNQGVEKGKVIPKGL